MSSVEAFVDHAANAEPRKNEEEEERHCSLVTARAARASGAEAAFELEETVMDADAAEAEAGGTQQKKKTFKKSGLNVYQSVGLVTSLIRLTDRHSDRHHGHIGLCF